MKVKEIMTTRVVTVTPDTPVPVIASLLRDNRISGVPVVDSGGAVVGLVSEYDLLAREGETARDVMTGTVLTVTEDTDVDDVRHLLVERRIRRVPVLGEGGVKGAGEAGGRQRLVGIVSRGDVVALLTTEWVCQVCGEAARGQHPPPRCPRCHADSDQFILQDACPGD
jgi:CBS domain-containing protein